MNKNIQFSLLLILCGTCLGCASTSGYWVDRGRDAADIFTATVGGGLGAKARFGPLDIGLIGYMGDTGLRGGGYVSEKDVLTDVQFFIGGWEQFRTQDGSIQQLRNKSYTGIMNVFIFTSPDDKWPPPPVWTELDVVGSLGYGFRLGFNPGELLDFILGWTTLDIYGDDLEAQKVRAANHEKKADKEDMQEPSKK